MSEKRIISLEVELENGDKVIKQFEQLDNGINKLVDSAENLDAKFEDVYKGVEPLTTRLGEAEDRLYELAAAGETTTKEYQDLLNKVSEYRKVQINTDLAVDAASTTMTQKLGGALGGVASGFELAQGTMALFGTESEAVQETLLKVQSAMAISQGIQGIKEASNSFKALGTVIKSTSIGQAVLTAATAAYNFVVGASTTALKLFRVAMISTGIGALVVGVGLLVANFDKVVNVVKNVVGWFSGLSGTMKNVISVIFPVVGAIRLVVMALEELGVIDNEQDKINAKNKENQRKRTEAELKQIEAVRKAREKNFNNEQAALDREIKLQEALGKSTLELQKAKINASIKYQETKKKELEQDLLAIEFGQRMLGNILGTEFEDSIAQYQNKINEIANNIENQKTDLKILDIEAKKAQQTPTGGGGGGVTPQQKTDIDVTRRVEDEKLRIREESRQKDLDSLALNYKRKLEDAEKELKDDKDKKTKIAALEKQYQESIKTDIQAINDKWDKIEKEARDKKLQDEIKAQDEQYNELQKAQNSARDQELFELMQSYDAKFELAKNNAELEKALTESFNKEQAAIIEKYRKEEEAKKKEADEKEKARIEQLNKDKLQLAKDGLQLVSDLADLFGQQDEKKARLAFQVDKAAKVSSATIAGYEAVLEAYKTGQKSPLTAVFPAYPYIQAGLAGAFAAVNIAKIAKSKFQSSGGGGGSMAPSGGGGAAAPMTANFSTIGSSGINQLAQLQQKPTQAYVVSGEVTSAQALDRNRVQNATL